MRSPKDKKKISAYLLLLLSVIVANAFIKRIAIRFILFIGALLAIFIIDVKPYIGSLKNLLRKNWGWPDNPVKPTFKDVKYGSYRDQDLLLDIYLPDTSEDAYPLIVFLHGGGWKLGNKELIEPGLFYLLKKGYAFASIDYTLVAQAHWPLQGEEVKGAVRWLRANAKQYHLDQERFAAFGGSAGGQLASFLGTTNGVKKYENEAYGNMQYSSNVQAAIVWYSPNDFLLDYEFSFLNLLYDGNKSNLNSSFGLLLGGSVNQKRELAKDASPYYHISRETTVPFLLMYGGNDKIIPVENGIEFDKQLKSLGIRSDFYILKGLYHVDLQYMTDGNMRKVEKFLDETFKREKE